MTLTNFIWNARGTRFNTEVLHLSHKFLFGLYIILFIVWDNYCALSLIVSLARHRDLFIPWVKVWWHLQSCRRQHVSVFSEQFAASAGRWRDSLRFPHFTFFTPLVAKRLIKLSSTQDDLSRAMIIYYTIHYKRCVFVWQSNFVSIRAKSDGRFSPTFHNQSKKSGACGKKLFIHSHLRAFVFCNFVYLINKVLCAEACKWHAKLDWVKCSRIKYDKWLDFWHQQCVTQNYKGYYCETFDSKNGMCSSLRYHQQN